MLWHLGFSSLCWCFIMVSLDVLIFCGLFWEKRTFVSISDVPTNPTEFTCEFREFSSKMVGIDKLYNPHCSWTFTKNRNINSGRFPRFVFQFLSKSANFRDRSWKTVQLISRKHKWNGVKYKIWFTREGVSNSSPNPDKSKCIFSSSKSKSKFSPKWTVLSRQLV